MVRRAMVGVVVVAVLLLGLAPAANAATTTSLLVPASSAFSVLGHSCGGIQEQAFATGFDATSGYPTGDVYLQTRCGGSGRGGGYHTTTYSAWVGVTWDFTGAVVSYVTLSTAPTDVSPTFSASDANGNQVHNVLTAVNVLPANCTVGNTTYCTYRAYLDLDPAFVPAPRLTSVSSSSGPAAGNTTVTIIGTGFTAATAVNFGSTAAANFTINSDTSITAVSPAAPAGTVDITVTSPGGTSATGANDHFTFVAAPTVSSLSPSSGPVTGGTSVTITGTGFTDATVIAFGDAQTWDFTIDSDTSITAVSPAAEAPDTAHVTVTSLGGTSTTSAADLFTYTAAGCSGTGPCVSIGDASMLEGDSGTHNMTFAVTLSQPATTTVAVQYAVTDGTATGASTPGPDADFQTETGTLTFKASAKTGLTPITQSVSVPVFGDSAVEPDEGFAVTLSNPTGGIALGRSIGTGTILNDDSSSVSTLGVGDGSIARANSGSQSLRLPVTLSAAAAGTITVHYTVAPDSATYSAKAAGGGDFGGKTSGTLTFAAGSSMKTIIVPIWPGIGPATDETFTVTLSNLTGSDVTLIRDTGTATILAGS